MWEQHKNSFAVAGAFVGLWFVLWLFLFRGYSEEANSAKTKFDDDIQENVEKLCSLANWKVSTLSERLTKANTGLNDKFGKLESRLRFVFSDPLIPAEHRARPQPYVRTALRSLRDYVEMEAITKRNIDLTDEARMLGFDIPDMMDEDLEQDVEWLRQMEVVRRFVDMLLSVHQMRDDKSWNIARIIDIRPLPQVKTGPDPAFILEYPVEVDMQITLKGLMRLLAKCSETETFHVVQALDMNSDFLGRESKRFEDKQGVGGMGERWYGHFYSVRLKLAAMTLLDMEEAKAQSTKKETKGYSGPSVIAH